MIITLIDYRKTTFTMEVDPSITILELKKRVWIEYDPSFHYDLQKMVYRGRYLDNDKTISEYGIQPQYLVAVLMVRSYYDVATQIPYNEISYTHKRPSISTSFNRLASVSRTSSQAMDESSCSSSGASTSTATSNANPEAYEMFLEMGFPHWQILQALVLSKNNVEFAANILVGSFSPSHDDLQSADVTPAAVAVPSPSTSAQSPHDVLPRDLTPTSGHPLDFLRTQPKFDEVQRLFKKHPKYAEQLLRKLETSKPKLYDCARGNMPSFMQMIQGSVAAKDDLDKTDCDRENMPSFKQMKVSVAEKDDLDQTDSETETTAPTAPTIDFELRRRSAARPQSLALVVDCAPSQDTTDSNTNQRMEPMDQPMEPQASSSASCPAETVAPPQQHEQSSGAASAAAAAGHQEVSPGDSEAIVRLMSLGFSNLEAAGAYVAFNKDEEKAADFLFSQTD